MFERILVAFDGSASAETALRTAFVIKEMTGATIKVVHVPHIPGDLMVAGTLPIQFPASPEMVEEAVMDIQDRIEDIASAQGADLPEVVVHSGDPAREILEIIKSDTVDLVVMGRRELGDATGLLLGSVTHKVQARSDCAVLTVG